MPIYPCWTLIIIVKYEAIWLCLHEISMSIDLCDCVQSFKQWFLFIYTLIVHMFHQFWLQKWPSWTVNMLIQYVCSIGPRKLFCPSPLGQVRWQKIQFEAHLGTSTSKHQLYICLYWLHCVNIMRQYSIARIFFSILIQNIWFQYWSYYLWHHT